MTFAVNEELRRLPLFQHASQEFVAELGKKLFPQVFDKGDMLFRAGEVGDRMYFVLEGECQMLSENGAEIMTLSAGSFVGEAALVTSEGVRSASARAKSDLNTMCLRRDALTLVLEKFPEQRVSILSLAQTRMAQEAIQKLIGSTISSEKEFQARITELLSQAINDKNKEIYRLDRKGKELQDELERAKEGAKALTMQAVQQKRRANAFQIQLHRQSEQVDARPAVAAPVTRRLKPDSKWHLVKPKILNLGKMRQVCLSVFSCVLLLLFIL